MFIVESTSNLTVAWATITVQIIQIIASIAIVVVGLIIGLILRYKVVQRLKKTVLDAWLIQTLGVLAILPTLTLALIALPVILRLGTQTLDQLLNQATQFILGTDFQNLLRNLVATLILI